jgi:hypothetical protein
LTSVYEVTVNRGTLAHLGLGLPAHIQAQITRWAD